MTEDSKLPFELIIRLDDMKRGIYHIDDADDNHVARVAGEGNAKLIVDSVNKVKRYEEALKDAQSVLADYAGKGELSDELYNKTEGVIPVGHASRCYLRIENALNQETEK